MVVTIPICVFYSSQDIQEAELHHVLKDALAKPKVRSLPIWYKLSICSYQARAFPLTLGRCLIQTWSLISHIYVTMKHSTEITIIDSFESEINLQQRPPC